jgi:Hypothetical glycosyl hydrolase 6
MKTDSHWLARSKARVFFDMHLPAWPGKGIAERFDPAALAGAIADSGADSAILFAKCQYGNFYTAIDGETLHPGLGRLDLLAETAALLRARGVRTIAYYSVSWDERFADEHPDWLAQNAAGERGKGPYRWRTLCINGPYAGVVERHLESLASKPIDGIWLDMTIIGDGNCYCPTCRARYQSLKGRMPPTERDDPFYPEFLGFRYDIVEAFYERVRGIVRASGPDVVFTNNYWGYPQSSTGMGSRAVSSTRQADFVTGEAYSDWSGIRSTSFLPLFLRGVAAGRPYEALIGRGINTWDYTRKPRAFISYEAYSLFAHGAAVTVDDEPFHDGRFDESFYRRELKEIFGEVTKHGDTVRGRPVRFAAVYHSQSSKDRCKDQTDFVRDISGAFRLLRDLRLPVEFVFDESLSDRALHGLSVLVLPNVSSLSGREGEVLSSFMESGGMVIASGGLGTGAGSQRLEKALGVLTSGPSSFSVSYLRLPGMCEYDILVRGRYARCLGALCGEGSIMDPICETGPGEFFHNNLPGPHVPSPVPGLITGAFGAGSLALFPQPIFRHYAREPQRELRGIVHGLMARQSCAPRIELLIPMKMDYSVYEDGDTLYVHLLNPNIEPSTCCGLMDTMNGRFERSYEYMEEVVPVFDLGLRIPGRRCESVETLREQSSFTVQPGDQGVEIRIARVDLWEIVKIHLARKAG